ncbi:MAG TPA: hypothetical protein VFF33_09040 [Ignavibacteriaceae bacterium]|nr:hypothetical protein [Ignavibacteriaceae bacterium]
MKKIFLLALLFCIPFLGCYSLKQIPLEELEEYEMVSQIVYNDGTNINFDEKGAGKKYFFNRIVGDIYYAEGFTRNVELPFIEIKEIRTNHLDTISLSSFNKSTNFTELLLNNNIRIKNDTNLTFNDNTKTFTYNSIDTNNEKKSKEIPLKNVKEIRKGKAISVNLNSLTPGPIKINEVITDKNVDYIFVDGKAEFKKVGIYFGGVTTRGEYRSFPLDSISYIKVIRMNPYNKVIVALGIIAATAIVAREVLKKPNLSNGVPKY